MPGNMPAAAAGSNQERMFRIASGAEERIVAGKEKPYDN
jgi:hypothetical protein